MANKDGYQLSHLFELSPTVIKDTSGVSTDQKGSRAPSAVDVARLQTLTRALCVEEKKCPPAP